VESLFARATRVEVVESLLPSGRVVMLRSLLVRFGTASPDRLKKGALPATYIAKPLVTFNGAAMFGELAVLRWLETDGWEGAWLDTAHGRKVWRHMPTRSAPVVLPPGPRALHERIITLNAGRASGTFDLIAWRGDQTIFVEYKGPGDRSSKSQAAWIEAALAAGVSPNDLLFVVAE
jgi:hypothetical protein